MQLTWQEYSTAPNDAIMLVKEWVSSTCLSQPPKLVLPSSFLDRLKDVALAPNGRNVLPQRTADELLVDNFYRISRGLQSASPSYLLKPKTMTEVLEICQNVWLATMEPHRG